MAAPHPNFLIVTLSLQQFLNYASGFPAIPLVPMISACGLLPQQLVILCICMSISPTLGAEVLSDKSKSHWFSAFYLLGQSGDFKAPFVPDWKTEVHIFFL